MVWADIRRLRSGDPAKRLMAVNELAASGDLRAVGALTKALNDADVEVRRRAAHLLAGQGHLQRTVSPEREVARGSPGRRKRAGTRSRRS